MINRCTSQPRRIINIISYGACHFYLTGRNTEANLCTCKMCLAYSQICKNRAHSYLIFCGSAFFPFVLQIIVLCLVWLLLIIIPSCWIQFQILSGDSFVCTSIKRCLRLTTKEYKAWKWLFSSSFYTLHLFTFT